MLQINPQTLKVKDRILRAITYLSNGQSCEQWLPADTYSVIGECSHNGKPATKLERVVTGMVCGRSHSMTETWYIGRFS